MRPRAANFRFALHALLGVTVAAVPLSAQTAIDSARTRLPVVAVTASRSGALVFNAPLAVSQISKSMWRGKSGYGLDDALSLVPGVLAQSRYGSGDIRLIVRGFGSRGAGDRSNSGTSRGVRILVNGIPETEPDGRTSYDGIDLAAAEGIEIVRSNASALWGNAAGGVVNVNTIPVFTRAFVEEENTFGGFGLKRFAIKGGRPIGNARTFGTLVNTSFDGWRANSGSQRTIFDGGLLAPLGDRTTFKALLLASANRFSVPGPLTQAQMDADPSQAHALYLARRERRDNKLARLGLSLDHQFSESQGFSTMAFVQPKYLQRSERNSYRDFNRYHMGGNAVYHLSGAFSESIKGTFSAGTDVAYQDGTILFYNLSATQERGSTLTDNKREGANNFGVFVNEDLAVGDHWVLALGARYDAITYTYSSHITPSLNTTKGFTGVTPKIGLTYKLSPTNMWYVSMGGGVEVPAGNETDPEAGTPNAVFAINPLLEPIRSTTYEAGTRRVFAGADNGFIRSISYDAAAFLTNVTNEIVPYNGGRFYFTAGKAQRTGAELGGSIRTAGDWMLQGAFTMMNAEYQTYIVDSVHYSRPGHVADYSGNKVVGVPSVTINGNLSWAPAVLSGIRLQAGVQHVGEYSVDDANKVKVPASTIYSAGFVMDRAWQIGENIGIRGSVMARNLTGQKYVGSAYLNPDLVAGAPAAFEPGLPRQLILSLAFERSK